MTQESNMFTRQEAVLTGVEKATVLGLRGKVLVAGGL